MTIQEIREAGHAEIADLADLRRKEVEGDGNHIETCFSWNYTKEGYEFWDLVTEKSYKEAYEIVSLEEIKKRIGKKEMKQEKVNRIKDICKEAFKELLVENASEVRGLLEDYKPTGTGSFVIEKKAELPTSMDDVNWRMYGVKPASLSEKYLDLLELLDSLLVVRDIYRQGWKPEWNCFSEDKYCIKFHNGIIDSNVTLARSNRVFAFQTKELRDKFYDNFKEELETVKELWS